MEILVPVGYFNFEITEVNTALVTLDSESLRTLAEWREAAIALRKRFPAHGMKIVGAVKISADFYRCDEPLPNPRIVLPEEASEIREGENFKGSLEFFGGQWVAVADDIFRIGGELSHMGVDIWTKGIPFRLIKPK